PSSFTQPAFNPTPAYPLTPALTSSVNAFAANIQVPSADSVSVGIQRGLDRNTSVEVRYVGTWGRDAWLAQNYNEFDIFGNGFLSEFRKAQANLKANIAAGRGATFAYTGAPGTSPLPIFLAFLNGIGAGRAGDTAAYTGTNWLNSTFLGFLAAMNPNPFGFASTNAANGFVGNST